MSFIHFLNTSLNTLKITPTELLNQDVIKTEKILKVECKINPDLDINYLGIFLDAIKNNKKELLFLINETFIFQILTDKEIKLFHTTTLEIDNAPFKDFVAHYLTEDLLSFCEKAFKNETYTNLKYLNNYKNILPTVVQDFIEKKATTKLDYILVNLKKGYFGSTSLKKSNFIEYASTIDSHEIKEKKREVMSLVNKEVKKTASTPGIVFFFKTIFNGLHYLSVTPNSIEEKEEKKYALNEMFFIFKILGGIVLVFIIGLYFANSNRKEQEGKIQAQNQIKFSKSILGHLSNYTTKEIRNFKALDSVATGTNILNLHGKIEEYFKTTSKELKISNNTDFDAILVSYDMLNNKFVKSWYIKKQDTLSIDSSVFYICLGNELGTFSVKEKNGNLRKSVPRFRKLYKYNSTVIDDLVVLRTDLEINNENGIIYLNSEKPLSLEYKSGIKVKFE